MIKAITQQKKKAIGGASTFDQQDKIVRIVIGVCKKIIHRTSFTNEYLVMIEDEVKAASLSRQGANCIIFQRYKLEGAVTKALKQPTDVRIEALREALIDSFQTLYICGGKREEESEIDESRGGDQGDDA